MSFEASEPGDPHQAQVAEDNAGEELSEHGGLSHSYGQFSAQLRGHEDDREPKEDRRDGVAMAADFGGERWRRQKQHDQEGQPCHACTPGTSGSLGPSIRDLGSRQPLGEL